MTAVEIKRTWTIHDEVRAQLAILKKASHQLNIKLDHKRLFFVGSSFVEPHGSCQETGTAVFFHGNGRLPGYPRQWSGTPRFMDLTKACSLEPAFRVIALALDPAGAFNSDLITKAEYFGLDIEVGTLQP